MDTCTRVVTIHLSSRRVIEFNELQDKDLAHELRVYAIQKAYTRYGRDIVRKIGNVSFDITGLLKADCTFSVTLDKKGYEKYVQAGRKPIKKVHDYTLCPSHVGYALA